MSELDEAIKLVADGQPRNKETYKQFTDLYAAANDEDKPKIGSLLETFLFEADIDLVQFVMKDWAERFDG